MGSQAPETVARCPLACFPATHRGAADMHTNSHTHTQLPMHAHTYACARPHTRTCNLRTHREGVLIGQHVACHLLGLRRSAKTAATTWVADRRGSMNRRNRESAAQEVLRRCSPRTRGVGAARIRRVVWHVCLPHAAGARGNPLSTLSAKSAAAAASLANGYAAPHSAAATCRVPVQMWQKKPSPSADVV